MFQDITNTYKYPEQTREERMTMEKALRKSESIFARYYLNDAFNDVTFDFELQDDIKIGQDFNVVRHRFLSITIHRKFGLSMIIIRLQIKYLFPHLGKYLYYLPTSQHLD